MDVDLTTAKAEALANATRNVAAYLQHPEQLDKVEQYRRRVMRNKASVEARLKNAVQSQLDDVRSGLHQLQNALQDVKQVKKSMSEVDDIFRSCTHLGEQLDELKKCHEKHSEAAKACQHLNQIYTVPVNVIKMKETIQNGRLLESHKILSELEETRDEVLVEVHRMEKTNSTSKKEAHLVYDYFSGIEALSKEFVKQLMVILERILSTVLGNPAKLVTVLRIIEREERADKKAIERQKRIGFIPGDRPKELRKKCFTVLQMFVSYRFESLDINATERGDDRMWLVKLMERTRQVMVEDLIVIKTTMQQCFPPSYNIFDRFVKMYHTKLSETLEDLVCTQLESDECVSILTWIREYEGPSLMMHPELQIDARSLEPLLKPVILDDLKKTYFETTSNNINEWMNRLAQTDTKIRLLIIIPLGTLELEKANDIVKDWSESTVPDNDGEGYYITPLPVFLFQMVDQNLQVAAQAGDDTQIIILDKCAEHMQQFQRDYREAVRNYRKQHLEDRNEPVYFVPFVIAIANNCLKCIQFTEQLQGRMTRELEAVKFGEERQRTFQSLVDFFKQMGIDCCNILLDEVFLDIEEHFKKIMTRNDWYKNSVHIETILATIEDYNNDFSHVLPSHHTYVLEKCLDRVLVEYIRAMTERRMKLKNYSERKHTAEKIEKESTRIAESFTRLGSAPDTVAEKCSVLPMLSEIIKLKDTSLMSLEISGIAGKYEDFTSEHAMALLAMREDVGRGDANQLIMDTPLANRKAGEHDRDEEGIFSQITVVASTLWDKLEMVKAKTTSKVT